VTEVTVACKLLFFRVLYFTKSACLGGPVARPKEN
jgi:hypothetical protein